LHAQEGPYIGFKGTAWTAQTKDLKYLADLILPAPTVYFLRLQERFGCFRDCFDNTWMTDSERYMVCNHPVGPYGDWPICQDWLPETGCIAYSFGIGNVWDFDDALALRHRCEVHSFDPTDRFLEQHLQHKVENVHFHFSGLGITNRITQSYAFSSQAYGSVAAPLQSLELIMSRLKHRVIHVLKIDCEGCEWEALSHAFHYAPGVLSCVRMILLELHFARRHGDSLKLRYAAELGRFIREHGWKMWWGSQIQWGDDRPVQELLEWRDLGGATCCINVALVNSQFDTGQC